MTNPLLRILTAAILLVSTQAACADDSPPNILLIMADDLGAENLACYGNTVYSTPNLDRMAAEGALFENAYATPVCTPTRAMILTGLYPNRTGFLERLDSPDDVEKNNRLPVHLKTFGHVFQSAGYRTAIAGKWHLGDFQKYPDQPTSHGFDEHCLWVQYWDGERRSRYYGPHNWENGKYKVHGEEVFGPDYYCDFLIDFMQRTQEQQRRFFAYFPMNLIHSPLITPPGNQDSAEARYPKDLGQRERKAGQMVHYMDSIVGRLLSKLKELGLDQNTLVLFTGDNGTGGNLVSRLGEFHLRGGKRTMNEAGTRVPFVARWSGKIPPGKRDSFITLTDMLPTLASTANVPVDHEIDGMDLSHNLFNSPGKDRDHFFMAFEGDVYFVRDKRFRLHEDGRFYDVAIASNETRYDMSVVRDSKQHANHRRQLQHRLDEFMAIKQTDDSYSIVPFGTNGDNFKNAQDKASESSLRELIVSHSDGDGILQLYRIKEDGTKRKQLTYSKRGCRMPAVSSDGRNLVYIEQTKRGLALCLSDLDGKNARALADTGMNLIPSWFPDSKHVVWMITQGGGDPSVNSQIHLMNTETGESRRLFNDPQQLKFSNSMPVVSPNGRQIAFISNRSGHLRLWVSKLDGSEARLASVPQADIHAAIQAPIEQKVPAWSPDGKSIAHWEGVEMKHMSRFTGIENRQRDQQIAATFHVWIASADGQHRRRFGRGDDPSWSPDGFVTRAFPDPERGGPKIMIETATEPKELPLVPPGAQFGRFTWIPKQAKTSLKSGK